MMKQKSLFLTLALLLVSFAAWGQNMKENDLATVRIGYLTKKLSLTPEEAQVFWPVYNQYQDELKVVKKEMRVEHRQARKNFDIMTDAEVANMVDNYVEMKGKEYEVFLKFHKEFQKVLPIRKVAKLYQAEQDFTRLVLKRINNQQNGTATRPRGGNGNRPMNRNR